VVCGDDPNIRFLLPKVRKRVLTYGFGPDNSLMARDLKADGLAQEFMVEWHGARLGRLRLGVPGRHNAQNALAAVAVGLELGLSAFECLRALEDFQGVGRRFEIHEEVDGVAWVDDYGHHPTEIAAVLATVRSVYRRRLVVVFQPHRYSRTRALAREFAEVLRDADLLVLADVYGAGERPIPGVSSDLILDALRPLSSREGVRVKGREDAPAVVAALLRPGDCLLTLGAGDVTGWGELILAERARRKVAEEVPHGQG
jgi:UDP-N-acetylmuramate--alanine ligase